MDKALIFLLLSPLCAAQSTHFMKQIMQPAPAPVTTWVSVLQTPASNTGNVGTGAGTGSTLAQTMNSTTAGTFQFVTGAVLTQGDLTTNFRSFAPTNGQGCATWTNIPSLGLVDSVNDIIFVAYYCTSSLASTTSITWTLTIVGGSTGWITATHNPWEVSYTGAIPSIDNSCDLYQGTTTASPVPACQISSITGSNDALFSLVFRITQTVSAVNGTGWTGGVMNNTFDSGIGGEAYKLNTTVLTPPNSTLSGSDTYDTLGVAIQ
jgi:hypothetical protein